MAYSPLTTADRWKWIYILCMTVLVIMNTEYARRNAAALQAIQAKLEEVGAYPENVVPDRPTVQVKGDTLKLVK
jgi:hypothetical protein